jgi:hypothetical protein
MPRTKLKPWPDASVTLDYLPGKTVRLLEITPIPFDTDPRRQWKIWIDEAKESVLWIDRPLREVLLCSEHGEAECDHRTVAKKFMEESR